jgi:hypothetical protein
MSIKKDKSILNKIIFLFSQSNLVKLQIIIDMLKHIPYYKKQNDFYQKRPFK